MQAASGRRRDSGAPGSNRVARFLIVAVVVVLTLWLAIAIFIAGLRWAIDPEKHVDVGGPQAHSAAQDYDLSWGWAPAAPGARA
jgi:hypothetical protein